ncbi:MAG TPA: nucleoside-diphosphate kinase [Nitrospirota bacterium]|nr:nucleoside-diphosphate kinase [Nitrospirota bacterium]
MEKTFAIIKPDAVSRKISGKILSRIEENGFTIVAMKKLWLTKKEAEGFYAVHKGKPFFESLTTYMSSAPCVAMVMEKQDAIASWRKLMGATNPANADRGTIRKEFALDLEKNSVHGSDAVETAAFEIKYFFSELEFTS